MNQIKIGKFIADLRKEQNLTQKELAEKLNLSDKTVSKWECGKGLPDYSIMITLCDLMDISINELLSGERLSTIDYNQKAEENIINLIQESTKNQEKQKWDALIKIVGELSLVLIIFFSFLTFGGIDTLYRFFDIPSFIMVAGIILLMLLFTNMIKPFFYAFKCFYKVEDTISNKDLDMSLLAVKLAITTSAISGIFVITISIITLLYNINTPLTIGPSLVCGCLSLLYSVIICLCLIPIMINLIRIKITY